MKELVPLVLGLGIGVSIQAARRTRLRGGLIAAGALAAGMSASAINGELKEEGWFLFVSIDTLLVGLGVIGGLTLVAALRVRMRYSRQ